MVFLTSRDSTQLAYSHSERDMDYVGQTGLQDRPGERYLSVGAWPRVFVVEATTFDFGLHEITKSPSGFDH